MKEAVKIALIYIIVCSLYILFSDRLVHDLFPSTQEVTHIQTYKGLAFVLISGSLIFFLIKQSIGKIDVANSSLKKTISHNRMIFEKCPLPAFIIDRETLRYLQVNEAAMLKFGRSETVFLEATALDFLVGVETSEILKIRDQIVEDGYMEVNLDGRLKDGSIINQQLFCQKIMYEGKEALFIITLDITVLNEPEKVMMDKMLELLEEERRRIAREIHDGLKQYFGLAHGLLKSVEKNASNQKMLGRAAELMEKGIDESRRLSHSITPQTIVSFNLSQSLTYLVENLNMLTKTKFTLSTRLGNDYSDDFLLNVYRIVQEATNNIKAHAGAEKAFIDLHEDGEYLHLEVRDDGKGFDTSIMSKSLRSIGLTTMRTRVSKFDGVFSLSSKVGEGTTLQVRIPLRESVVSG